ncbi:MAG TPA: hypothetical protein VD968_13965, partial [Pyrinomonadaceae bacterium]|nr:hypothetical protein [Pyrinomonadaceae bacterium]
DLRLGAGYNWAGAYEPFGTSLQPGRRGFYFTISSKLSNLFDLFGTSSAQGAAEGAGQSQQQEQPGDGKKREE